MPCDSSYMASTPDEDLRKETHEHLVFVLDKLSMPVPQNFRKAAEHCYGEGGLSLDGAVRTLCSVLSDLSGSELDRIVYDARNAKSRKLADWWERHCKADAIR